MSIDREALQQIRDMLELDKETSVELIQQAEETISEETESLADTNRHIAAIDAILAANPPGRTATH